jgi:hypothetical protein
VRAPIPGDILQIDHNVTLNGDVLSEPPNDIVISEDITLNLNGYDLAAGNVTLLGSHSQLLIGDSDTLYISGELTTNNHIFGGTVIFNGTAAQPVIGDATFNNMTISGPTSLTRRRQARAPTSGSSVILYNPITLKGNLIIESGSTLDLNGQTLFVGGEIVNDGTINYNGGSLLPQPASACLIYGVHDEGLNDSQFVAIDLIANEITPVGEPHIAHDIEALVKDSSGKFYCSSGNDAQDDHPKGHLYQVDKQTGVLTSKGDICFEDTQDTEVCGVEVSALAFEPTNGTLFGWAEGYGLISINPDTAISTLEESSDFPVEELSWNAAGTMLYGVANRTLLAYDGQTLRKLCTFPRQVEALASLPDEVRAAYNRPVGHDLLMYSEHNSSDLMIRAIDAQTCETVEEVNIYTRYNDLEGLIWACDLND